MNDLQNLENTAIIDFTLQKKQSIIAIIPGAFVKFYGIYSDVDENLLKMLNIGM